MFRTLIAVLFAGVFLTACELNNPFSSGIFQDVDSTADARAAIPLGLTMDQVRERVGPPKNILTRNNQTIWEYTSNSVGVNPATFLPVIGSLATNEPNFKSVAVTFNSRGRVSKVDYYEQTTGAF